MNSSLPIAGVLLTTRDRPDLLAQSLPQIEAQAAALGLPLVIADDDSKNPDAIRMILRARGRGATVLFSTEDAIDPLFSTGRRFITAVQRLMAEWGSAAAFIKVDDDVFMAPRCFETLVNYWNMLAGTIPALSAFLDCRTEVISLSAVSREVVVTNWASSVCCIHRLDLWSEALATMGTVYFEQHGWDVAFFWHWLNRRRHGSPHTLVPSLVYHAGHIGTRTTADLNRQPPDPFAFPGSWTPEGVITSGLTQKPVRIESGFLDGRTLL